MRFLQRAFAAISFSLMAVAGTAVAQQQATADFRTLDKPVATESGKKVEVIEFFWYSCPHCNALEPALVDWVKQQGERIEFKRMPVAFRDSFVPQQKLYFTLEALGRLNDLHPKVFHAIHKEGKSLDKDAAIVEWAVQQGVDKQKFLAVYDSFGMQSKVSRAKQLQAAYQIDGVPTLGVDGRYLTSPAIVSAKIGRQSEPALHAATLQVLDRLVAKAAQEKGGDKAATGASTGSNDAGKKAK